MVDGQLQAFGDNTKEATFLNMDTLTESNAKVMTDETAMHYPLYWFQLKLASSGVIQERRVYGLLDMIGDIGGLNDAVALIFQFLASQVTGSAFTVYAVQQLFTVNRAAFRERFKTRPRQGLNEKEKSNSVYENLLKTIAAKTNPRLKKEECSALIKDKFYETNRLKLTFCESLMLSSVLCAPFSRC